MADASKVSDLNLNTAPANTDIVNIIDDPGGSPVSEKATVQDLCRFAYGNISVTVGVATQTPTAATWTKVTQFTAESSGLLVTAAHATDKITLTNAGQYVAKWMVSFVGAADEYRLAVYWNGVLQLVPAIVTIPDANEHSFVVDVPVNATAAAQDLEAFVYTVGGNIFDVKESVLQVHRVA
jgi:hypothetical protein